MIVLILPKNLNNKIRELKILIYLCINRKFNFEDLIKMVGFIYLK